VATLTNLGFETGVPEIPGLAPGWAFEVVSTVEEYAAYDAGYYPIAWESFRFDWGASDWARDLGSGVAAIYTEDLLIPAPEVEHFAVGWDNLTWILGLAASEQALYDSESADSFEGSWNISTWQLGLASTTTATYDGENYEDFEESWNIASWTTSLGANAAASYDGTSPESVEDFEEVTPLVEFAVEISSSLCIALAHPLLDDDRVRIDSTGTPPGGLTTTLDYYVVNASTNTFQLAREPAGTPIDFDHQGGGSHYVLRDPSRFWNRLLED
jgi:hypothetical protein